MGVTEVVFLPLKQGSNPDDGGSPAGQTHTELVKAILSQPGAQRIFWGRQVEDSQLLRWFIDWDDIEAHQRFIGSDAFRPVIDNMETILGGAAKAYHARFDPHPATAALSNTTSPATEIVTMWFPILYSPEDRDRVVERVKSFVAVLEKDATTYTACAGGWVDEEIDVPGEEERGSAYVFLVGWTSVEAHLDFQKTQAFKDNIHYIMEAKDLRKIEAVHVHLTEATQ